MSEYKKIALVNPPLDSGWREGSDHVNHWQPLNLLALISYLREHGFKGEAKILDHVVMTEEKIRTVLEEFKPDLVGFSPNLFSYETALELAKLSKEGGADVIIGGNYASLLAENIVENQRGKVDFVIKGDGEQAFFDLVEGTPLPEVKNLVWRDGSGGVVMNPEFFHPTPTLAEIDYTLVDLDPYFANYRKYSEEYPRGDFQKPFAVFTQKGCYWRYKTGGCSFCSRIYPDMKYDDPKEIWERFRRLKERYGMDCFLDVSEDFSGNKDWLREFYEVRPDDMKEIAARYIYSRATNITESTADILAGLNTQEILFGFESGDDDMLAKSGKGGSAEKNIRAMKRLAERGVGAYGSFVGGLEGETEKSLQNTLEHVKRLLDIDSVKETLQN